jgi:hypothetical protein
MCIVSALGFGNTYMWMNGNDLAVEGTWLLSNRCPMPYEDWVTGMPDNHQGRQNCASVAWNFPQMDDHFCETMLIYICEIGEFVNS